eukprot:5507632-Pyramimonas_sp.AAC.1
MIDDVVDEQAYIAQTTGAMLVMLVLGDGQSWKQLNWKLRWTHLGYPCLPRLRAGAEQDQSLPGGGSEL